MKFNSFKQLAQSRRSIRAYTDDKIANDLIEHILRVATWAPSAHNRQPWRFAVVKSPDKRHLLARAMGSQLESDLRADSVPEEVIRADVERSYRRITGAAVAVCLCMSMVDMDVYPDASRNHSEEMMAIQSTAMAGQNLLLAAHAAGLGACWMCAPLFCPEIVRETLDLPQDWQPQALITMGYPDQHRERTRHSLDSRLIWR
jgi:coenzyme F420-0:L-glutamate ligase/coenzyme F420-1:gamma-L-glutamate ligase